MNYQQFFDDNSRLIKLEGESYITTKKLMLYSLMGNFLKFNHISLGLLEDDLRINAGIPIKSGYGKSIAKSFVNKTEKALERRCSIPTSLHPEQLVGKSLIIRDKEGNVIETKINKGYLADDFVMFDEAVELLTDKAFQQARDYINIALDPIGDNEILKRSVEVSYEDSVKYIPSCSMIFFWHPIPITESIVTRGLLRRLFITNIVVDAKEREEVLRKSVYTTSNNPKQFNEWIGTLNRLSKRTFDWTFSDTGKKELVNLTKKLINTGVRYSEKISEFTDIMYFTLRNRLAKMACVLAALDGTPNVSLRHLRFAYIDLREFWYNQMTYVEEKVLTGLSFGVPKAKIRKKMCLDVLKDHKAFSEETSPLSIADLLTEFGKRADISEGNARYYYLDLVKKGIVQSRKYAHSSRVWYAGAERELKKDVWRA